MERPNRISRLRTHEGLTLKQLAAEIEEATGEGCSESTLSRWENGNRPVPDAVKLFLAERFEVAVAYVMKWPAHAEGNGNGDNGDNGDDLEEAV